MPEISSLITLSWVNQVLREGKAIEEIISDLESKGFEIAETVEDIDKFEGEGIIKGPLRILKVCPMAPLLAELKRLNNGRLPEYFDRIVNKYKERYPRRAGILHPLCIVHQIVRKTFGMKRDLYFEQIACRSSDGVVAFCEDGIVMSGLTEGDAKSLISGHACLYYLG